MRRSSVSPLLFSWDVASGASGVTDDKDCALRHVQRELLDAPCGTCGVVRRVELTALAAGHYAVLATIAVGRRDELSGAVLWD